MTDNHDTENKNEWINWIEEAIDKEHIKYYEYKEFSNFQEIVVRELRIHRIVDFHDNIICFHGITKFESVDHDNYTNYMLVLEYADCGSLQNYLENNFSKLTWNDKYLMAFQLACAVSCMHDEGIIHCDLHSGNILVHQNTIKLADFGGQPLFYGENYDVGLILEISQGHRETVVPDTPEEYVKIYTKCWDV
ncbi:unnamed protein product [Rhizophagus irregularis]|nr:unnamed protein product [Rhizophagus irregularis]